MRIIHLSYRKIIDSSSQKLWDKYVFEDTYMEFYMQAQYYNQENKYATFQELLDNVPNADRLHQQTSMAAIGYIRQLNNIVPDIVNQSGKLCLPFTQFKFDIIHSHVSDKQAHKVAITFYSEPLTWIDTVGNTLLIAYGDRQSTLQNGETVDTDMITLQPYLSIASCQYQV
ncbi:hypothetical protein IC229_21185 [Spirosoma sp. BT702]|uniref:Uncharacterized protein n=1 Tax=Spirosoma profusum TaxID=2771354 RepID=A0A926XYA6_9BACT|nr:hypothetical protein [Spirosoma profusum]MBD2703174.1 hypothetical protein [Spirosoma profusum]